MEENLRSAFEQAAAVQKVWMDSLTGVAQVWSKYSPENPPPEELKKIRKGMLDVISASWEEFMRTPQFMEMMRESMNNAMTWQGLTTDGANRLHDVFQTASKRDVDGLLLAVRHVERRLLDEIESVEEQVADLGTKVAEIPVPDKAPSFDFQAFQKSMLGRLEAIETAVTSASQSGGLAPEKQSAPASKRVANKKTKSNKS